MGSMISKPRCVNKITSSFRRPRSEILQQVGEVVSGPRHLLLLPPELHLTIYEHYFSSFTTFDSRPPLLKICQLLRMEATESYQKHLEVIWNDHHLQACWIVAKYRVLCDGVSCEAEMKNQMQTARSAAKTLRRELRLDGGELDPKALRLEIDMKGLAIKMLHSLPKVSEV